MPVSRACVASRYASAALRSIGETGVVGSTDPGPIDLTGTPDGRFLYVETGGTGTIDGFAVQADGTLTPLPSVTGFGAAGIEGIAAD